ncbi:MAG: hypothetical protein QM534_08945 [Sediminibacterium sp.]|nr:hypothetical protein [Sediminibacterium sp.]
MIPFILYGFLFLVLIYYNGCFGLFKDEQIRPLHYTLYFAIKLIAVPAFYFLYQIVYGGIEHLDAGKFYSDVCSFNQLASDNLPEFLKALTGLQNENPGSYIHTHLLLKTQQWDNGLIRSFLFNDNRVLIRLHGVLHFLAFRSYFVHALFATFYSYIGLQLIYKSLKHLFKQKEHFLFGSFVLFPSLWLFTGALLKEPITVLCIGLILFTWHSLFKTNKRKITYVLLNIIMLLFSIILKPYILLPIYGVFGIYFALGQRLSTLKFSLAFFLLLFLGSISINQWLQHKKNKSLLGVLASRHLQFNAVAQGGIFLANDSMFLRLPYDSSLITKVSTSHENNLRIKKGAGYTYWLHDNNTDTLYCSYHTDTLNLFHEAFRIQPSRSNILLPPLNGHFLTLLKNTPSVMYYVCLFPFYTNARGLLDYVISIENTLLLLAVLGLILCFIKQPSLRPFLISLITLSLLLFIIIGYTSPNTGAIVRYRCLLIPFLLASGLSAFTPLNPFRKKPN